MSLRHAIWMLTILLLVAGLFITASGQSGDGNGAGSSGRSFDRVPGSYQAQLGALGRRARMKGKEKTTYTGELFDKAGKSTPVQIIHQLPNLVRLEGFKSGRALLAFDGERAIGVATRKEELYLETFSMDMAEGMLSSVQASAAIRLLGRDFGPDPKVEPNYSGPRFDIYDVTDTVRCRRDPLLRSKYYYFDSITGLLVKTRYHDQSTKPAVAIETHFSMWGSISGSVYPARIDHYEGEELEFTFIAEQIISEPSTDVVNFR
jgi:hypothetical protein